MYHLFFFFPTGPSFEYDSTTPSKQKLALGKGPWPSIRYQTNFVVHFKGKFYNRKYIFLTENLHPSTLFHIHESLPSTFKLALSSMVINCTSDSSSHSLKLLLHRGFQFHQPSSQKIPFTTLLHPNLARETKNKHRNSLIKGTSASHLSLQNKVDSPFSTFLRTYCSNQSFTLSTPVMLSTFRHHVETNVELKIIPISLIRSFIEGKK